MTRFARSTAFGAFFAAAFGLAAPTPSCASPVTLQWCATLTVLPGQGSNLPVGVMDGDMIMGSIDWDPEDAHFGSSSIPGASPEVANYDPDAWTLDLGAGNVYSRTYIDGLGPIGNGNIQIRNDDDTVADGLTLNDAFNFQNSLSTNSPPINEYFYALRLINDDRTWFDDFVFNGSIPEPVLPTEPPFGGVDHTVLSIYRIQQDPIEGNWSDVLVAEMSELSCLSVPEPPALVQFGFMLAGLLLLTRRANIPAGFGP
jgi:hypothetical protein